MLYLPKLHENGCNIKCECFICVLGNTCRRIYSETLAAAFLYWGGIIVGRLNQLESLVIKRKPDDRIYYSVYAC